MAIQRVCHGKNMVIPQWNVSFSSSNCLELWQFLALCFRPVQLYVTLQDMPLSSSIPGCFTPPFFLPTAPGTLSVMPNSTVPEHWSSAYRFRHRFAAQPVLLCEQDKILPTQNYARNLPPCQKYLFFSCQYLWHYLHAKEENLAGTFEWLSSCLGTSEKISFGF